jgi:hypothetical protein
LLGSFPGGPVGVVAALKLCKNLVFRQPGLSGLLTG